MKKIVHYDQSKFVYVIHNRAYLYPLDHPDSRYVSNNKQVVTSTIVEWNEVTGVVETQNTIYKPKELGR